MNIVIDKRTISVIAVVVIIAAIAVITKFYIQPKMQAEQNAYSVVYLITGEVYIGHLSVWPRMELNGAYLLQSVKDSADEAKTNIQLAPLKDALWSPKKLFLNKENVIFYGPLEEGSKAAETLRNAGK